MFGYFKRWNKVRKEVKTLAQHCQAVRDEREKVIKEIDKAKWDLIVYNVSQPTSSKEVDTLVDKFTIELTSLDKEIKFREEAVKALKSFRQVFDY